MVNPTPLPPRLLDDEETVRLWVDELTKLQDTIGWRILMQRLQDQKKAAMQELVDADALDAKVMMQLQNRVKRFEWFKETPQELIAEGLAEEQQNEAQEEDQLYGDAE